MTNGSGIRRVLQVHTRYRQAGGEDRAVEAERLLLDASGIAVEQVIFDNADLADPLGPIDDLRLAASAIWSRSSARRVALAIKAWRPDVVHVHNTFVAASASVFRAAWAPGIPVVQTLHNYRMICPAATLYRDGHPCSDCVGAAVPLPAAIHSCVRGSVAQSAVAVVSTGVHRAVGTFSRHVQRFIALTDFQRAMLVRGGLPPAKISVVPNFLGSVPPAGASGRSGFLYVGRLADEKGIDGLLAAASRPSVHGQLDIAGSGPRVHQVTSAAGAGRVRYLGHLTVDEVAERMRTAVVAVVPSVWYEGFPMVVIEAYAAGTPVIASRIGSLAEVVEDGVTGILVAPGDGEDLARAMQWAAAHPQDMEAMGRAARRRYDDRYTGDKHLTALLGVYSDAMLDRARSLGTPVR